MRVLKLSTPLAAAAAIAATRALADGPPVVRLTLHPVATTEQALRYRLLPPMVDQHAGDGSFAYMAAANQLPGEARVGTGDGPSPLWTRFEALEESKADPFPIDEAADVLHWFPVDAIDDAARCERAQWDVGFREHGYDTHVLYLNDMFTLARVVALRGRLAVARGDLAGAERSIQTNLAMVRQLDGDTFATLVQSLVAGGIEVLTIDATVQGWVSHGASPNLYWSLSSLPPTFADLYTLAQTEQSWLRFTDPPWIGLAVDDRLPPDQWPRVFQELVHLVQGTTGVPSTTEMAVGRQRLLSTFARPARAYLRTTGRPAAAVAAVPDEEAVSRYLLWQYRSAADELWKAYALPFPQAVGFLRRGEAELAARGMVGNPLVLLAGLRLRYSLAEPDQRMAALRTIEALRDYAARHGGRPPASLDQITDLPVPPDPITGQPFAYHADRTTATLDLAVPAGLPPRANYHPGRRYELTFVTP